jgi:hypothetical protein
MVCTPEHNTANSTRFEAFASSLSALRWLPHDDYELKVAMDLPEQKSGTSSWV